MSGDLCFDSIDGKFAEVLSTTSWRAIEEDFRRANTVFIIGNGGNLAIADHASVDVSRLTNKKALCPGSGILGSSLINDTTYNDWLDDWLTLQVRDMSEEQGTNVLLYVRRGTLKCSIKNIYRFVSYEGICPSNCQSWK